MSKELEINLAGQLNFFLQWQIKKYEEGIFINELKYTKELLKKFNISSYKPIKSLMSTTYKLKKDQSMKTISRKMYKYMIGSILTSIG